MSGISLTASLFYCHSKGHTLQDVTHLESTDRCEAVLIMEMLESIVGENEPQVKFEPYGTNEPSEMLKLVQHDLKEGEDHQIQHDEHMGRGK